MKDTSRFYTKIKKIVFVELYLKGDRLMQETVDGL